jgi:hypothetical protein
MLVMRKKDGQEDLVLVTVLYGTLWQRGVHDRQRLVTRTIFELSPRRRGQTPVQARQGRATRWS